MLKEDEKITISSIMQKCCVSYIQACKILAQMLDMGYSVGGTKEDNAVFAEILNGWLARIGRGDEGNSPYPIKAPAQKCSEEGIKKILAEAPQKREDMIVSLGEYSAFGFGTRVYIDYGKDIAYKRVNSPADDSYYLLSIDIPDFVRRLKEIVSSWEHEMVNHRILDGMCYHVSIQKKGEDAIEYRGQNKFPENYREFRALLRSLSDDSGT